MTGAAGRVEGGRQRRLGVNLERSPGDVEFDAAHEVHAGFLEVDRPRSDTTGRCSR
jgi:hypothetical protein